MTTGDRRPGAPGGAASHRQGAATAGVTGRGTGPFDPERYRAEVLDTLSGPGAAGDPLRPYALTAAALASDDAFDTHLAAVVGCWRALVEAGGTHAALARRLLDDHARRLRLGGLDRRALAARLAGPDLPGPGGAEPPGPGPSPDHPPAAGDEPSPPDERAPGPRGVPSPGERRLGVPPPPAPTRVEATADAGRVLLRWAPSPVGEGRITYRVECDLHPILGPGQGTAVGETSGHQVLHEQPPSGVPLHYAVFAVRDGQAISPPAAPALQVLLVPEVTGVRLAVDGERVTGTWRAPAGATGVAVTRRTDRPPRSAGDGQRLGHVDLDGFVDDGVVPGKVHHYRIVVLMAVGGRRHASAGVLASVEVEEAPIPVADLAAAHRVEDERVVTEITWSPPGTGTVSIHAGDTPSPWPPGTVVDHAKLAQLGGRVEGTVERLGDGRCRLLTTTAWGARYLTAVTSLPRSAVVGPTVALTTVEPVRRLELERFGDVVRVAWVWPADVAVASVRWWPTGDSGRERHVEVPFQQYLDDGGVTLPVRDAAVSVAVRVSRAGVGGVEASPEVVGDVPGMPPTVAYGLRRRWWPAWLPGGPPRWVPWPRRGAMVLTLSTDRPCQVPNLVVVRKQGRVKPLLPEEGTVVERVGATYLLPGEPLRIEFELPRVAGPYWLCCFVQDPGMPVVLTEPPIRQLRWR
jgi:hypothetical protein